MAKDFDIYLKRHLTECDLLVYSITYRDGLSVSNRLILEAALNGYILQKFAAVQMGSKLTAHIDDMIKLCLEKLNLPTELGITAEFEMLGKLDMENAPFIVDASVTNTLERVMNEVQSGLVLAVEPLATQLSSSTGQGDFPLILDADVTGTLKRGLLSPLVGIVPDAAIDTINQVNFFAADVPMVVNSTLQSLCYQLTNAASVAVDIAALVLGTEIRHSLGRWYNGVTVGSTVTGTWAQKFITAQAIVTVLQEATGKLIKVLYPDEDPTNIEISDVNAGLKRYRLLGDMDDLTLAELDDSTLEELDYVWLT